MPSSDVTRAMNQARIEAFTCLFVLNLIGFGPVSLTALIGLYLLWTRPPWFLTWARGVYGQSYQKTRSPIKTGIRPKQIKASIILIGLFIIDVLPVPVTGSIALFIICFRPKSFLNWLESIYSREGLAPAHKQRASGSAR